MGRKNGQNWRGMFWMNAPLIPLVCHFSLTPFKVFSTTSFLRVLHVPSTFLLPLALISTPSPHFHFPFFCYLLDWRIKAGDWKLSGMKSPASVTVSVRFHISIVDGSVAEVCLVYSSFSCSVQEKRQPSLKPRVTSEEGKIRRWDKDPLVFWQRSGTNLQCFLIDLLRMNCMCLFAQ